MSNSLHCLYKKRINVESTAQKGGNKINKTKQLPSKSNYSLVKPKYLKLIENWI